MKVQRARRPTPMPRPVPLATGLVNGPGFGGWNAALLMEKRACQAEAAPAGSQRACRCLPTRTVRSCRSPRTSDAHHVPGHWPCDEARRRIAIRTATAPRPLLVVAKAVDARARCAPDVRTSTPSANRRAASARQRYASITARSRCARKKRSISALASTPVGSV